MARRIYRFMLRNSKEVAFIGTEYYPVEVDPNLSPYTTVLATIWDGANMAGQVNQTEILAWWTEAYEDPAGICGEKAKAKTGEPAQAVPETPAGVLLSSNPEELHQS